jgi:sugar phosphate isomerase/epimerase
LLLPGSKLVAAPAQNPRVKFPASPRERICISCYSFRNFIAAPDESKGGASFSGMQPPKVELKDFAGHVRQRFNVNKIELWTGNFPSTDAKYMDEFLSGLRKSNGAVANIAVDGEHSPYSMDSAERDQAVAYSRRWVDVAAAVGSPGIRTNLPPAKDSKPDVERTADTLKRVVDYSSSKNVVISLENDNPVSEDPFFLVKVIEKVGSPWLHALPDFGNTLLSSNDPEYAYRGVDAMFAHAYCICHVKNIESNDSGKVARVDLARTFAIAKKHHYKGYCSMEYDDRGDVYKATADLVEQTVRYLS